MKVLVLGGSGHIGARLIQILANSGHHVPTGASRNPVKARPGSAEWIKLDSCDPTELTAALRGFDAVVNCVAGDADSISKGAQALVQAALNANCPRIVHLSTMSVYGPAEGTVREDAPLDPGLGWYGRAKCEAERQIGEFARQGGKAVVLRPGCVFGPGSALWVGRIARLLQAGRLGDLGIGGDGWSNLVHVDDVCRAITAGLQLPAQAGDVPTFNLAAPDSPRWNEYFVDLALALGIAPVRRIHRRQLKLDAWLAGPPLKIAQIACRSLKLGASLVPDPLPPGLLRLWSQHIHLDAQRATRELGVAWMPYATALDDSVAWLLNNRNCAPLAGHAA